MVLTPVNESAIQSQPIGDFRASRFRQTVVGFVVTDALFLLFLTYGYAFPAKMTVPDPQRVLPATEYDYSAKASPFDVSKASTKVRFVEPRS